MRNNTILAIIGVAILAIVFFVISLGTHRAPKAISPNLTDYINTDTTVQLTIEGPVTANEKYYSRTITIGRNVRTVQFYKTYANELTKSQDYANNQDAFDDFMHALAGMGFDKQRKGTGDVDEKGMCPNGQRYVYEIIDSGTIKQRLWSDSCSTSERSFGGNGPAVRELFINQIPDYQSMLSSENP